MRLKLLLLFLLITTLGLAQQTTVSSLEKSKRSSEQIRTKDLNQRQAQRDATLLKKKDNPCTVHKLSDEKGIHSMKTTDELVSEKASPQDNVSPFDAVAGKKEITEKRDLYSKTYQNTDGSFTALIGAGPIHYQKNGQFLDIDHKITQNPNSDFPFVNATNLFESYFGATAHKGVKNKTAEGEISEFLNTKMYWEVNGQAVGERNSNNAVVEINANKAFYRNLYGNIDAEFSVEAGKRNLNYLVENIEALGQIPNGSEYLVLSEDVEIPLGWMVQVNKNGEVEVLNQLNQAVFIYAKPELLENYLGNNANIITHDENIIFYEIQQIGNRITFLLKVSVDWLKDEGRVFPIAIDPTVYPNNSTYWTGWAYSGGGNNDNVIAGYWSTGNAMAGYSKFNLSSIPSNSLIGSAQINLYYHARFGDLVESFFGIPFFRRQVRLVDIPLDPVPASYAAIANSPTEYISSNAVQWDLSGENDQGIQHWKNFTLATNGIAYVQNALTQGYVAVAAYPDNDNWVADNYAWFKGYSDATYKPQLVINYTTTCSTPSSSSNSYYIRQVDFVGSLIPDTQKTSTYTSGGYANYATASDPIMAQQIPGNGINVITTTDGVNALMKAWVDWDGDGLFDTSEKVYDTGNILTPSTVFGFVVPSGTTPGIYKLRVRTNRETSYFFSCGSLGNGETEDYKFEVIADCSAKITAVNINPGDGILCGSGSVRLTAQGSLGTTQYRWYASEFGGTPIHSSPNNWFDTPDISDDVTYWVTAYNGSCESVKRTPVVARIEPTPNIILTQSEPDVCGNTIGLSLQSSGDKEEFTLLDEKFNTGLGAFQNSYGGNTNSDARWQNRPSPYVPTNPPYYVLSPAVSSGYSGGNYAVSITDVAQTSNIINYLTQSVSVDATELLNLKLEFDLYYQPMAEGNNSYNYFKIQASANNGSTWTDIATYNTTQGNPGSWANLSYTLSNSFLVSQFKIRFVIFAYGDGGWVDSIAAIDNIRLYGDKPLSSSFAWTAPNIDLFDADCTTPYSGDSSEVCIKANDSQIENYASWTVTANAALSNGCTGQGQIVINNNNKVWNPAGAVTDWASTSWKPNTAIPTADQCVIVKKSVNLNTGTHGVAKNIKVESGGKLNINTDASLTLTDYVRNEGGVNDFVIKNGANLVQVNDMAVNTGDITQEKQFDFSADRKEYNFVISPLVGFSIGQVYPGTTYTLRYDETDNYFKNDNGSYVAGKGFAVKEATGSGVAVVQGKFEGVPFNGELFIQLKKSGTENGYNLIGNPYPSVVDIKQLYDANSSIIEEDIYFWDNRGNSWWTQEGSNYGNESYHGNQYAVYNAQSDTGNGAPTATGYGTPSMRRPNRYVKPGTGFLVRAKSNNVNLEFNNNYRSIDNSGPTFAGRNMEDEGDFGRYWVSLKAPTGLTSTAAIVYFQGGNNNYWLDDSQAFGSSDEIYSIVGNHQLGIQGKELFQVYDVINLGFRGYLAGIYTIDVLDVEGVFADGQKIFLRDKDLGVFHDFDQGSYTFKTRAGEFNNRFEIVYLYRLKSSENANLTNSVQVQKINHQIEVSSDLNQILEVEFFNINGRSILKADQINSHTWSVPVRDYDKQIIVVVVKTETGEVVTKKLVNK